MSPRVAAQVKQMEPEMADIGRLLREAKVALKVSKRVDYYALLEVDATASDVDIKKVRLCSRPRGGGA